MEKIKELHTVALLKNIPKKNLYRGDVGTVVTLLSKTVVEVEFTDENGRTTAIEPLDTSDLIRLRMETVSA